MNEELTEEEMRRALFGGAEPLAQTPALPAQDTLSCIAITTADKGSGEKEDRQSVHTQVEGNAAGGQ